MNSVNHMLGLSNWLATMNNIPDKPNGEFQQGRPGLDVPAECYAEFYNFAPVGFFILTREGVIRQANFAGASLLGLDNSNLVGRHFAAFVCLQDRPAFNEFLAKTVASKSKEAGETRLQTATAPPRSVHIEAATSQPGLECSLVVADITERKLAEEKLRESEALFRTIAENVGDLIAMLDTGGRRIYNNPSYRLIFGNQGLEVGSDSFSEIHPDDRERIKAAFRKTVATGIGERAEFRFLLKDGSVRHIESEGNIVRDSDGKVSKVIVVSRDMTDRKLAEEALLESEQRFRAIFENAAIGIARISLSGHFLQVNQVYCNIVGYSQEEVLSQQFSFQQITAPEDRETCLAWIRKLLDGESGSFTMEKRYIRKDGSVVWVNISASLLRDGAGNPLNFISAVQDITMRKTLEEQLRHLSNYDILTDLPNRILLGDRTRQALATAKRDKTRMAMMYVDLDDFKPVNDRLGHNVGDMLLKAAAMRMQDCVRASDTVARIGGDEFVVLLPAIENEHDAVMVAEKVRSVLCQPFSLGGHGILVSSSIGIAVYPDDCSDEKSLLNNADAAMYYAKKCGRNTVRLFSAAQSKAG
jgi:diguanylate cyclase (GGDEF)-like protein/PAS domain S-box-containing protein